MRNNAALLQLKVNMSTSAIRFDDGAAGWAGPHHHQRPSQCSERLGTKGL